MHESILHRIINKLKTDGDLVTFSYIPSGKEIADIVLSEQMGENRAILFEQETAVLTNIYSKRERIISLLDTPSESCSYNNIKLSDLPIFKIHDGDVSGSINLGCVTANGNSGIYRIQPLSDEKAVVHCYPTSGLAKELLKGKDVPVTIAIGTLPKYVLTSAAKTKHDLSKIPDGTDVIIKGTVSASQKHPEGPFMIYTGEYSKAEDFPLMTIESVQAVKNPIYQTLITGKDFIESRVLLETAKALFEN